MKKLCNQCTFKKNGESTRTVIHHNMCESHFSPNHCYVWTSKIIQFIVQTNNWSAVAVNVNKTLNFEKKNQFKSYSHQKTEFLTRHSLENNGAMQAHVFMLSIFWNLEEPYQYRLYTSFFSFVKSFFLYVYHSGDLVKLIRTCVHFQLNMPFLRFEW